MVDLSKKTFIFNGYTFKKWRSLTVGAPEDQYKQSDKSIYGERRIIYTPDPNMEITITVPVGTEDEKILLNASENVVTGSGYFKDSSSPKYNRGVTIKEIGVNKSELPNDGESDSREFKLVCTGVKEAIN
ncbi:MULTISPECIES: hypothetical protein [Fusobacterium]|uniref:hypothetical protein n=1 Tax=Fusobacterium TaxID=848 RepID=UPI00300B6F32